MLIRVNKKISSRTDVKYAALSAGTVSAVWYDEESASKGKQKRRNKIKVTRETEATEV